MIYCRVLKWPGSKPSGLLGKGTASAKAQIFSGVFEEQQDGQCGCSIVRDRWKAKNKMIEAHYKGFLWLLSQKKQKVTGKLRTEEWYERFTKEF